MNFYDNFLLVTLFVLLAVVLTLFVLSCLLPLVGHCIHFAESGSYCSVCGESIYELCPGCGCQWNPPEWKVGHLYCDHCGACLY